MDQKESLIRLDKWLWACRFYKTRSLAKDMIEGGKVHYNGQRCKASKTVETGATIRLTQGSDEKTVVVLGLSEQRLSAPLAQALYEETAESIERRELHASQRKMHNLARPDHRPSKKDRRDINRFKQENVQSWSYHDE